MAGAVSNAFMFRNQLVHAEGLKKIKEEWLLSKANVFGRKEKCRPLAKTLWTMCSGTPASFEISYVSKRSDDIVKDPFNNDGRCGDRRPKDILCMEISTTMEHLSMHLLLLVILGLQRMSRLVDTGRKYPVGNSESACLVSSGISASRGAGSDCITMKTMLLSRPSYHRTPRKNSNNNQRTIQVACHGSPEFNRCASFQSPACNSRNVVLNLN